MTPYKMPRKGKRIANAQEADWGLPTINGALIGKQVANWIADRHFGPRD